MDKSFRAISLLKGWLGSVNVVIEARICESGAMCEESMLHYIKGNVGKVEKQDPRTRLNRTCAVRCRCDEEE